MVIAFGDSSVKQSMKTVWLSPTLDEQAVMNDARLQNVALSLCVVGVIRKLLFMVCEHRLCAGEGFRCDACTFHKAGFNWLPVGC